MGFFMDGVQLPQGYRVTTMKQLTVTTKFREIPGTHLINV